MTRCFTYVTVFAFYRKPTAMLRQVLPSLEMKRTSFTESNYFVQGRKIHTGTQFRLNPTFLTLYPTRK